MTTTIHDNDSSEARECNCTHQPADFVVVQHDERLDVRLLPEDSLKELARFLVAVNNIIPAASPGPAVARLAYRRHWHLCNSPENNTVTTSTGPMRPRLMKESVKMTPSALRIADGPYLGAIAVPEVFGFFFKPPIPFGCDVARLARGVWSCAASSHSLELEHFREVTSVFTHRFPSV